MLTAGTLVLSSWASILLQLNEYDNKIDREL